MSVRHEPVLLEEVLRWLKNGPGLYLDATLGDGGHAEALLDAEPGARLWGGDRDPDAILAAGERLSRFGDRAQVVHAAFHDLPEAHLRTGGEPLAGALFDLGLSSRQLDDPARGMSFQSDGPLDMRMDRATGSPASERLRHVEPETLAAVLRDHGDVPDARRLARVMVEEARADRLATTGALAGLVDRVGRGPRHPRTRARVFQALRTWVNDEASELDHALAWIPGVMRDGGVVVTLAYHSGEDRRIKRAFRGAPVARAQRRLPEVPGTRPPEGRWEELTRRGVTPSPAETERNPRARSARLRAFRRTRT